jgi:microcystin-dependent protein
MSNQFLGELRIMGFGYAPKTWALCNGQLMSIAQNQALFSLLGTTYGGNGVQNFALPNLQGCVPAHQGPGYPMGMFTGATSHTLLQTEIPQHLHTMKVDATVVNTSNAGLAAANTIYGQTIGVPATGSNFPMNLYTPTLSNPVPMSPGAISMTGNSQPHENRQPLTVLNICIAMQGIFPSRN